jgi:putative membrane protein
VIEFADHFWHGGFPWFWVVGLVQPVLWILLLVVIVGLFRRQPPRGEGSQAEAILAERYARGEIDRDEFLERRAVLRGREGR